MAHSTPSSAILVTGAAGFMGAHLVRYLQAHRQEAIIALDDLSGGFAENIPDGVTFVEGSVTDAEMVQRLFCEHPIRTVYHLAAYAAEGLSHFIRRFNYTNNLIGSTNLINEAVRHEIDCFVFTSSIAVYGGNQLPMHEELVPQPEDPYGVAKYAVEMDLACAHEMFGLDYVIFRPHNVYGEFQNIGDKYRNVVGIFMNQILQGQPLSVFGNGEQKRAFSYVGDLIPALADCVTVPEARNQVFNIGADQPYSINQLARAVMQAMGVADHPLRHLEARNEVVEAWSSHEKADRILGKQPATELATGLQRMADWVQQVGARATTDFAAIEVERNLPPSWR